VHFTLKEDMFFQNEISVKKINNLATYLPTLKTSGSVGPKKNPTLFPVALPTLNIFRDF